MRKYNHCTIAPRDRIFARPPIQHFHLLHLQKQVNRFFAGSGSASILLLPFDISGLVSKADSNLTGAEQVARHLLSRCEQVGEQVRHFPTIDDVKERDSAVQGTPPDFPSVTIGRILNQHNRAMLAGRRDTIRGGRP